MSKTFGCIPSDTAVLLAPRLSSTFCQCHGEDLLYSPTKTATLMDDVLFGSMRYLEGTIIVSVAPRSSAYMLDVIVMFPNHILRKVALGSSDALIAISQLNVLRNSTFGPLMGWKDPSPGSKSKYMSTTGLTSLLELRNETFIITKSPAR